MAPDSSSSNGAYNGVAIGARIADVRERAGLTPSELAERAGLGEDEVRTVESGEACTLQQAYRIASALALSLDDIAGLIACDDRAYRAALARAARDMHESGPRGRRRRVSLPGPEDWRPREGDSRPLREIRLPDEDLFVTYARWYAERYGVRPQVLKHALLDALPPLLHRWGPRLTSGVLAWAEAIQYDPVPAVRSDDYEREIDRLIDGVTYHVGRGSRSGGQADQ